MRVLRRGYRAGHAVVVGLRCGRGWRWKTRRARFVRIPRRNALRYRTLRVARPIIARISEMIQKRITICGSAQPCFSK